MKSVKDGETMQRKLCDCEDRENCENHKCWELWSSKSQTFVLLIRICQFKCAAVNHDWLKLERTKDYCRDIVALDFYRGLTQKCLNA